ncbi:M48 family metallopeptidase [Bacillus sp. FJAT-27445]|uniref:M48 family metallopeptidase n=1 Tax=Bacillus sp. FJAT-27445 TaxID=1679166 RepID=UPI00074444EB|nr:ankyrin repeat domain-containing protein [Bacillus sp. FJAT-27445]
MNHHEPAPRDLIYRKEKIYFWVVFLCSILSYILFAVSIIGLPILVGLFIFSFLLHGIMMGQIRSNAVKLSPAQFPEVYNKVEELCGKMELRKVPDVYVMQSGGVLNAFATRFFRKNMVVVYSEIFDLIEEGCEEELTFVLAHELAHIKRNHLVKMAFILPAMWIPGLAEMYLRACEYTCDRYAAYYSGNPAAAKTSLAMLAIGKKVFYRVNQQEYMNQLNQEKGFFVWLSEILSTHPPLPKRIHEIQVFFADGEASEIIKKSRLRSTAYGLVIVFLFSGFVASIFTSLAAIGSFDPFPDMEEEAWSEEETSPLIQAVIMGDTQKAKKLAQDGADLEFEDYNSYTALDWAIKSGDTELVKMLLNEGADPNYETGYSMTPLMTAAEKGNPEILELLKSAGAKVNYQESDAGMTALMYAAMGEDEETVKLLLAYGADPSLMDYQNMTAYMHAIDTGSEKIATLLKPVKK